jgi:hypothetical protein
MTTLLDDQPKSDLPEVDPNKDYFAELVGENAKFKTPQDLARGKYESDKYIEIILRKQDELREDNIKLREEVQKRASLQELVDQLRTPSQTTSNEQNPPVKADNTPSFKPEDIQSLIRNEIPKYEAERKAEENFNQVKNKLKERFGNNYASVLNEKINELGLNAQVLDSLARTSPKAVFKALELDEPPQTRDVAPPRTSQRTPFKPSGTEARTWTWYQDLKRKSPEKYNSKETTLQMQEDYMRLGAQFEDGDFHKYN